MTKIFKILEQIATEYEEGSKELKEALDNSTSVPRTNLYPKDYQRIKDIINEDHLLNSPQLTPNEKRLYFMFVDALIDALNKLPSKNFIPDKYKKPDVATLVMEILSHQRLRKFIKGVKNENSKNSDTRTTNGKEK